MQLLPRVGVADAKALGAKSERCDPRLLGMDGDDANVMLPAQRERLAGAAIKHGGVLRSTPGEESAVRRHRQAGGSRKINRLRLADLVAIALYLHAPAIRAE